MTIPETILAQLGGRAVAMYTGAQQFGATYDERGMARGENDGGNTLIFKIGRNSKVISHSKR